MLHYILNDIFAKLGSITTRNVSETGPRPKVEVTHEMAWPSSGRTNEMSEHAGLSRFFPPALL